MYSKDYTYVVIGAVLLAVVLLLGYHMSARDEVQASPADAPTVTEEGNIQDNPESTLTPKLVTLGIATSRPRWADEIVTVNPTSTSTPKEDETPAEPTMATAPEATAASESAVTKQISEHVMMKMAAAFSNEDYVEEMLEVALEVPTEPEPVREPAPMPEPEREPEPVSAGRYASLAYLVEGYRDDIARLIYHEDRGNGDGAVLEVVFNRILSPDFPNTIPEVIYQEDPIQFSPAPRLFSLPIDEPDALERCYELIDKVLYEEEYHIPVDYCYFNSRSIRTPGPTDYEFGGNVYFK